ncbi:hypothetical protein K440DRAFT_644298 [Wilcoxina mikolae CBS 423.85]|nr:hypothetical protein K440DRAFT_644298 [Wilcoxina mikolae CBS 423.85]
MRFSSILFVAATALFSSPLVSAECNKDGELAFRQDYVVSNLDVICSILVGEYYINQKRRQCFQVPGESGKRWDFTVERIKTSGSNNSLTRTLGKAECIDGLRKEVQGCQRGGWSSYSNWLYKFVIQRISVNRFNKLTQF